MPADSKQIEQRFEGCLLGAFAGDCLGAVVQAAQPAVIRHRYGSGEQLLALAPASYTCVSEMLAATATSLALYPQFDGAHMAACLLEFYSSDRGYGQGSAIALERLRKGCVWSEAAAQGQGRGCSGNGAASRIAQVGLLDPGDTDFLRWVAEESAGITHQHSLGAEGAVLMAFGVALAVNAESLEAAEFLARLGAECQVREFRSRLESARSLLAREPQAEELVARLGNNSTALGSVVTALYCFAANPESFAGALAQALSLGGNSSSIAAMTGALSGAYLGRGALPPGLLDSLERSRVSVELLAGEAAKLASFSPASG